MPAARFVGGALLLAMAVATLRSRPATHAAAIGGPGGAWRSFAGTFLLTASNPMTILSFAGLFAGIAGETLSRESGFVLAAGILLGSTLWWLLLSFLTSAFHSAAAPRLAWINRISALALAVFGLSLIVQL